MPFSDLDLMPTDRTDPAGRPIWLVEKVEGKEFRYFQSADNFQLEALVKEGYETNFASVPRFLWRILPPDGKYRRAAIVHDWLYDAGSTTRWMADAIFYEAMTELNVPPFKRFVMWLFVRLFAKRAYKGRS